MKSRKSDPCRHVHSGSDASVSTATSECWQGTPMQGHPGLPDVLDI